MSKSLQSSLYNMLRSSSTQLLPCVQLFATPWTVARQAPLSMEFPRQEYWSGLPFPSPGDLPDPGIEPASPALAGRFYTTKPPGKPHNILYLLFQKKKKMDIIFICVYTHIQHMHTHSWEKRLKEYVPKC